MKYTTKETIKYIKNGKERKINLSTFFSFLNSKKIKKELLKISRYDTELDFKESIEFIHLENVLLKKVEVLRINRDAICILENCYIKNEKNTRELNLYDGSFEIINPAFFVGKNKVINLSGTKDANLVLNEKDHFFIKGHSSWNHNLENITINSNYAVSGIDINCKKISMYGYYTLEKLQIFSKKIIIGNEKELTKINLESYRNIVETDLLILNNTIIINNTNEYMFIRFSELIGNNFLIKSKGDIYINGNLFPKKRNEQGYIEITMEDVVKYNFINTLRELKGIVNNLVDIKTKTSIPEKFGQHLLNDIKLKQEQIDILQREHDLLKNKYETEKGEKERKNNKILKKTKIDNLR